MDTLHVGVFNVVSRHCGDVESHSAGKLTHQLTLEIFPALVLLPTVNENLILLKSNITKHHNLDYITYLLAQFQH